MRIPIENYDLLVMGTRYDDPTGVRRFLNVGNLTIGDKVTLLKEPTNPKDPLAILVLNDIYELGYIPKDENAEIFYYLSFPEKYSVEAQIKKIESSRDLIVVIVDIIGIREDAKLCTVEELLSFLKNEQSNRNKPQNRPQSQTSTQQKKKMNGCLKAFIIVCAVLGFLIFLFIFIAFVSAIFK